MNNTKLIQGINYAQKESRSKTFADDISICIKRDPRYLKRCVEFLTLFAKISGLLCNLEKTAVIPIGGNYDINNKICPELALGWENKYTLLVFKIDNRLKEINDKYEKCFKKVHEISRRWARWQGTEYH